MADPRLRAIADALAVAARQQGVIRVADLDFERLAAAVEAVARHGAADAASPLDPEGDGLTAPELNAANDG